MNTMYTSHLLYQRLHHSGYANFLLFELILGLNKVIRVKLGSVPRNHLCPSYYLISIICDIPHHVA